jgi:hypothetical protein
MRGIHVLFYAIFTHKSIFTEAKVTRNGENNVKWSYILSNERSWSGKRNGPENSSKLSKHVNKQKRYIIKGEKDKNSQNVKDNKGNHKQDHVESSRV